MLICPVDQREIQQHIISILSSSDFSILFSANKSSKFLNNRPGYNCCSPYALPHYLVLLCREQKNIFTKHFQNLFLKLIKSKFLQKKRTKRNFLKFLKKKQNYLQKLLNFHYTSNTVATPLSNFDKMF